MGAGVGGFVVRGGGVGGGAGEEPGHFEVWVLGLRLGYGVATDGGGWRIRGSRTQFSAVDCLRELEFVSYLFTRWPIDGQLINETKLNRHCSFAKLSTVQLQLSNSAIMGSNKYENSR